MATNPLYSTNNSPNNATQPTKAVNRQSVHVPRTHNNFDMSYWHFKTQKFGQYEPFFVMECVPGDTINFANSHNVRALPFSSPFLSDLKLNKDYFMVPNMAIQPNTYDYIFREPSQGEDVPSDVHNVFPLGDSLKTLFEQILNQSTSPVQRLYALFSLELFCSNGSLLYNLGYKINPTLVDANDILMTFDKFFEDLVTPIVARFSIDIDGRITTFGYNFEISGRDAYTIDAYTFCSLIRRFGSNITFHQLDFPAPEFAFYNVYSHEFNMDRVIAYQMACYQYYVNPQVDFIYNAQLYRDNLFSLWQNFTGGTELGVFHMNGITVPYDFCSKYYYEDVALSVVDAGRLVNLYDYLSALFGFVETLRFGDYFTDSRTQALAPGDDRITVTGNGVSVIDVSKSIVLQRFRNAVVKLGNSIDDYLNGIFGTSASPDYHIPKFISHQEFSISGNEVANTTGDDQGHLITNLRSSEDTMAFSVEVDMPVVILGISYFTLPRVYCQTKERHFFHKDRFDYFNPMLQYTGDQTVYMKELTDSIAAHEVFGYQSRYNEYKQRYSVASGGFVDQLPAWTFVTDTFINPVSDFYLSPNQSPVFIRSADFEFNRFLSFIPGNSLGSGFHFIVTYNNKCNAVRPMEVNPNIL